MILQLLAISLLSLCSVSSSAQSEQSGLANTSKPTPELVYYAVVESYFDSPKRTHYVWRSGPRYRSWSAPICEDNLT